MSWYELLSVYRENADYIREDRTKQPVDCPNDGEPLITDIHGRLRCRYDGWVWSGTPVDN